MIEWEKLKRIADIHKWNDRTEKERISFSVAWTKRVWKWMWKKFIKKKKLQLVLNDMHLIYIFLLAKKERQKTEAFFFIKCMYMHICAGLNNVTLSTQWTTTKKRMFSTRNIQFFFSFSFYHFKSNWNSN